MISIFITCRMRGVRQDFCGEGLVCLVIKYRKMQRTCFFLYFTRIYSVKLVLFPFNAKIEEQISYKTV